MKKELLQEILRGLLEGAGKELVSAGKDAAGKAAGAAAKQAGDEIRTRGFGLGPADEAKFALALKGVRGEARQTIIRFLIELSKSERNWFRRVVAEMPANAGTGLLVQYARLPNDEARKKRALAEGLLRPPMLTTTTSAVNDLAEKIRQWSDKRHLKGGDV